MDMFLRVPGSRSDKLELYDKVMGENLAEERIRVFLHANREELTKERDES